MTVSAGDRAGPVRFGPLSRTDLVRYAGASGDFNPLHHDETFARDAGLPNVMAHGMLSAGLLASFVTGWFGPGSVRRFKVRFREPVWPGDTLLARGAVTAVEPSADGSSATLELTLENQHGAVVVSGSAEVAVP